MRQMVVVMMVMVMGCGGLQRASDPTSSDELRAVSAVSRELARSLAEIDRFALGAVGRRGVTSGGEELTLALSRDPDAIETFTWIGRRAAPAPRLYAYWALRTLAPDRATALGEQLRRDGGFVKRMSGCFVRKSKVTYVLTELEGGAHEAMPRP